MAYSGPSIWPVLPTGLRSAKGLVHHPNSQWHKAIGESMGELFWEMSLPLLSLLIHQPSIPTSELQQLAGNMSLLQMVA